MKTKFFKIAAIVSLAYFSYLFFWPRDLARELESELIESCRLITFDKPPAFLEARINSKQAISVLSQKIHIHYRSPDWEFKRDVKKQEILDKLSAALTTVRSVKAGFSQFKVNNVSSSRIEASLFFIAEWKENSNEELMRAAEDVRITYEKISGEWLITTIETLPRFTL